MLTKRDIPTPAALLDLDAFEVNLERMAAQVRKSRKAIRPHAKAHKCVEIARRQIAAGACGVCVATVPEAELMASAGITGLLLTSPVADPLKIARAARTGAMVVVDHVRQAGWYADAAAPLGRTVEVLIDLDVGDHRTGARSTQQAIEIAEAIARSPTLRLRGLQAYSVLGSHAGGREHRERVSVEALQIAAATRDALAARGFSTEILSGGSTGSWDIDTALPELTELQAGSYVLMDLAYQREGLDFRHALTILATVVSANHPGFVTVDAGYKAFATDRGYGPEALKLPGSTYRWGGDEFGFLDTFEMDPMETQAAQPVLGDRIEFIPPHCDPTMNLHDTLYACLGERVESVWPVKRLA
jgi:3-hydroxy-D-aspartate aldolase